jgi:hypothetical protein
MTTRPALLALALGLLAGCSESVLRSDRVLGSIELSHQTLTATEGQPVPLTLRVLDQHGEPFNRLPPWIQPQWQSSDETLVSASNGRLQAQSPGAAVVTVRVAERSSSATVRVNPQSVQIRIEGVQLSQAIQRSDNSVPLVQGRRGFLRVFATADRVNFFTAGIRVRLFHDGVLTQSWTLAAPADSIPRELDEGVLTSTWNLSIPGNLIRTGTSIQVDADPEGTLPTTEESTLSFPAGGQPLLLDVRTAPPLAIRLVPIQGRNGVRGNVTEQNRMLYVGPLLKMFPLGEVSVDVRETYHTLYMAEGSDWINLLVEMLALRAVESTSHYYYGVVRRVFGPIGVAFLGYPVAVGFDEFPEAPFTLAHELGHNFNLLHAPCGGPDDVDRRFPDHRGAIGTFGIDIDADSLIGPETADLMGYCRPRWLSDYHYRNVVAFREELARQPPPAPPQLSLLVWGRISAGRIELKPALEVFASPQLPAAPGPYTLEGRLVTGSALFSLSFAPLRVDHGSDEESYFAFVVPLPEQGSAELGSLSLSGRGLQATRTTAPRRPGEILARPALPRRLALERTATSSVLSWDTATHPLVMIRDAGSGAVVSFAESGSIALPPRPDGYELVFSDGVRSVRTTVRSP